MMMEVLDDLVNQRLGNHGRIVQRMWKINIYRYICIYIYMHVYRYNMYIHMYIYIYVYYNHNDTVSSKISTIDHMEGVLKSERQIKIGVLD